MAATFVGGKLESEEELLRVPWKRVDFEELQIILWPLVETFVAVKDFVCTVRVLWRQGADGVYQRFSADTPGVRGQRKAAAL